MKYISLFITSIIFSYFIVFAATLVLAESIVENTNNNSTGRKESIPYTRDDGVMVEDIMPPDHVVPESRNIGVVIRVLNGDTLNINYNSKIESLKLIGIDAPENRLSMKARSEAIARGENLVTIVSIGIDAERFIKSLVKKGETVRIEFDVEARNASGMLLGYVFLNDGRMLNEEIVRAGYSNVINAFPNARYKERLLKACSEARAHRRGLWE